MEFDRRSDGIGEVPVPEPDGKWNTRMSIPEHLSQSSNDIDPNETPESLAALVQQMRGQLQGALRGNWHMEAHKKMRGWEEMMDEVARLAKRA